VIDEDLDVISYSPKKSDLEDFYVSLLGKRGEAR